MVAGTDSLGGGWRPSQTLSAGACPLVGGLADDPERCGELGVVFAGGVRTGATRETLEVAVPAGRPTEPTRLPVEPGAAAEPALVTVPTVEEAAEVTRATGAGADGGAGTCGTAGVLGAEGTLGAGGTRTGALAGGVGAAGGLTGAFAAGAVGAGGAATGAEAGGTEDVAAGTLGADGVETGVAGAAGGVTAGGGGTKGRPASALPDATSATTIDAHALISTRRCAAVRTSSDDFQL